MGHQRGLDIASPHRMVELHYGAPTLLQQCPLSSHIGAVRLGTNAASTLPAVIALWSCTMGHQRGFDIVRSHCTVEGYWAPTRLQHSQLSLHGGAVLWGTNLASAEHQEEGLPSLYDCLSLPGPDILVRRCSV